MEKILDRDDKKMMLKENQELNRYMSELQEDVKLTDINLREKSMLATSIRCKWLQYLFKEYENLRRIKDAKDRILKSKISSQGNKNSILKLKSEDSISNNDPKISQLNSLMQITKDNISYLEHAQNILGDFPWDIKNRIEILKLERT